MTEQPEALRLAEVFPYLENGERSKWIINAAAELRRLHEEVTEQGRLLSMSAERELSLLARIDRLEKAQKKALENIYAAKLCEFNSMSSRHDAVCRAIEAKLKEKNT